MVIAPPAAASDDAAGAGLATLDVNGDRVRIFRDEFGVPHVFAETNRGLFAGFGYVVAEDRLWQLELNRRAARGRLAEIFGATFTVTGLGAAPQSALAADRNLRTTRYADVELDAQLALLTPEEAEIFAAYAEGINRYVTEVVVPDPGNRLPFEFHYLGIGAPAPWTVRDLGAIGVYQARFGEVGGMERANQAVLNSLIQRHGPAAGLAIFNDARWIDDPDSPVSVPVEGAMGKRQRAEPPSEVDSTQLAGTSEEIPESFDEDAEAAWKALGIPVTLGSYGWVVSAAKSATGSAMLFGGPQVGFNAPELGVEVQLKGGNGFNVVGATLPGLPLIYIGRTDHIAWTSMTGTFGDNRDIYVETLCGGGTGYVFNGVCTSFETRVEVINVRDASPVNLVVQRTVHGPVVGSAPGVVFSQKRSDWQHEIEATSARLAMNRAHNLQEFEAAVHRSVISQNFLYADKLGNIAYWMAGRVPVRPPGYDPRLPLPGDGRAEWTGEFLPIPASINPARGWLANWNNKPSVEYRNPDQRSFGKQFRILEIEDRLMTGRISLEDMRDIAKDIARTERGGDGRESRFVMAYLLAALDVVPPANALAPQARAVLEAWDGSLFADAITSTNLEPGQVIFSKWLSVVLADIFADELGTNVNQATVNMLIHVLDDALGGGSGVPPSRDYFNGVNPYGVLSAAFDKALTALGADPDTWSTQPREVVRFRHPLYPAVPEVGVMFDSNRGTYAQIVVLSQPRLAAENIITLGQSGFIRFIEPDDGNFDSHFMDQLELYRNFEYKPMRLYLNTQLVE